jgi:hypothetical protein
LDLIGGGVTSKNVYLVVCTSILCVRLDALWCAFYSGGGSYINRGLIMALVTLIYVSSAVRSLTDSDIQKILRASREANGKKQITGLLLFKDGNFMQVLEGDAHAVDELHKRISSDPRHTRIITLLRSPIHTRRFSDWKMGFKDIGNLTEEEKAAHSDYLDRPLSDSAYSSNPNEAFILLESFKNTVR